MNSWAAEQFKMMGMNPGIMQNQMPPPLPPPDGIMHMMGGGVPEWNQNQGPNGGPANNFIGPIPPENQDTTMDLTQDEPNDGGNQGEPDNQTRGQNNEGPRGRQSGGNHSRDNRWNKNRDSKDVGRSDRGDRGRRPRSQDRNRDRSDRSRSDRRGERTSRFGPRDNPPMPGLPGGPGGPVGPGNMMMPGMMPFGNSMLPGQAAMDMPNMPHMSNMPNMPNMMPGMNMPHNMMGNMMPGMMDQNNMMMAQQQMQMMAQPIFVQTGVLLTPIPGVSMPPRRERPAGCRTIFVGGLPPGIGMDIINEIFEKFGVIDDIKLHKQGVCHIRFTKQEMVEQSFFLSGYRFKLHDQSDNEATTLFIDYALNRDDQSEAERHKREPTPPRIEPFTQNALTALVEKIKSDTDFAESAPTLAGWLEKGECNKKNANTFYSLIQACNNQVRRLYNEKMAVDEEFLNLKTTMKDKFAHIIFQFDQVAKILSAAKHKRASDHFSKQQRRNIEMWLKMTESGQLICRSCLQKLPSKALEELVSVRYLQSYQLTTVTDLENIKEEFNMLFDDEETEKIGQKLVSADKYEQLKTENDTLICELEGYRNEAHLAKDEAERKFEKFKAHFIAQQALHGGRPPQGGIFPPLPPPPPMPTMVTQLHRPPPTPDEMTNMSQGAKQEAKLVAMLTAFLLAHPLGATIDYLSSYVRSMVPGTTQGSVNNVLTKYGEIFSRQAKDRWTFVLFDMVKKEVN